MNDVSLKTLQKLKKAFKKSDDNFKEILKQARVDHNDISEEVFSCSKCSRIYVLPTKCNHFMDDKINQLEKENNELKDLLKAAHETIDEQVTEILKLKEMVEKKWHNWLDG